MHVILTFRNSKSITSAHLRGHSLGKRRFLENMLFYNYIIIRIIIYHNRFLLLSFIRLALCLFFCSPLWAVNSYFCESIFKATSSRFVVCSCFIKNSNFILLKYKQFLNTKLFIDFKETMVVILVVAVGRDGCF